MRFDGLVRKLGWAWLIIAPILIGIGASGGAGLAACAAETEVAASRRPAVAANPICRLIYGTPDALARDAVVTSPVDLASMRIALLAMLASTLFGVIAVLAGYKAFVVDAHGKPNSDALGCSLRRDATNGKVDGEITVSAGGRTLIDDLRIEDDVGRVVQAHPQQALGAARPFRWTVLAANSPSIQILAVTGRLTPSRGATSSFAATFDLTPAGYVIRSLTRSWP